MRLAAFLTPARAEEGGGKSLATRVSEHARLLAVHRQDRNVHGLHDEIWRAVALHREAADTNACLRHQARLVRGVGLLCRWRDERIRRCALQALGVMQDEGGRST